MLCYAMPQIHASWINAASPCPYDAKRTAETLKMMWYLSVCTDPPSSSSVLAITFSISFNTPVDHHSSSIGSIFGNGAVSKSYSLWCSRRPDEDADEFEALLDEPRRELSGRLRQPSSICLEGGQNSGQKAGVDGTSRGTYRCRVSLRAKEF
jgi:hypothetical protein